MTGEMSRDDVTRDAFPTHFAIADALGGSVHPFDVYQGPYISAKGHRLWLTGDGDGFVAVYSETAHRQTGYFPENHDTLSAVFAVANAEELIGGGGYNPDHEQAHNDACRLVAIGEA